MRRFAFVVGLVALTSTGSAWAQNACTPECASEPAQCCNIQSDQFLAEECTGHPSDFVHFVVTNGEVWIDRRLPATFDVSGLSGTITLGDVMPATVGFTIGTSAASARFQVALDSLPITVVGQCVGLNGTSFTGLPPLVSVAGRALSVLKTNPLFCRATGFPDLLCLGVRGQVGPPFQAQELCDPDRVEYVCGEVH